MSNFESPYDITVDFAKSLHLEATKCICELDPIKANIKPLDTIVSNAADFKESKTSNCNMCKCGNYKLEIGCKCTPCNDHTQVLQFQKSNCHECFDDFITVTTVEFCRIKKIIKSESPEIIKSSDKFIQIIKSSFCSHPLCGFDILEKTITKDKPSSHKSIEIEEKKQEALANFKEAWLYAFANCRICCAKNMPIKSKFTLLKQTNGKISNTWSNWILCQASFP